MNIDISISKAAPQAIIRVETPPIIATHLGKNVNTGSSFLIITAMPLKPLINIARLKNNLNTVPWNNNKANINIAKAISNVKYHNCFVLILDMCLTIFSWSLLNQALTIEYVFP